MRSVYFYTITVFLLGGVLFRSFVTLDTEVVYMLLLLGIAYCLIGLFRKRSSTSLLFLLGLSLLSFVCGVFRFAYIDTQVSPLHVYIGNRLVSEGVVAREPEARVTSQHLYIRDEKTGALFLAYADPYLDVAYGDRVKVIGELTLPKPFETDLGRVFDYPHYLMARDVREVMFRPQVAVLGSGEGNSVIRALIAFKHRALNAIELSIPEPAAGLGAGILLGVKRAIGPELSDVFTTVGIIHIVVLSGYNIMIVADWVTRFFGLFFYPRTKLILGITAIFLFILMVGLSATVIRAGVMAALVLIARTIGRPYAALRALTFAGFVMVLINPYLLAFDPGFQLSFLATLGLVFFAEGLSARLTLVPELLREHLGTTLGTQLMVLPLLLFSIGKLSIVSLLVNVLVLPFIPFAMLLTFITACVGMLSTSLGILSGFISYVSLTYIIRVAEAFAQVPLASVGIPLFPWWAMVLLYVPIIWLAYFFAKRDIESSPLIPLNHKLTTSVHNDYEGWVIEEVKER
jgi:competence protein ComEC